MARIVAAMAMTHSPGLTGWFDRAPKDYQEQALRAMDEMRERLARARPDAIVLFSNDHLLNWASRPSTSAPPSGTTNGWA